MNTHTYFLMGGYIFIPVHCASINTASTADETSIAAETTPTDSTDTRSILSIKYIQILHARNIFPQNRKDDLKANIHIHSIDMQVHSIPKPPNQKIPDMGLSDLHEEEFKLSAMEYNNFDIPPSNDLEYCVNTLQHHNEDYDQGINSMFLNNLEPIFYAMQMQKSRFAHTCTNEKIGRRRQIS
jgi:hypothetical protein